MPAQSHTQLSVSLGPVLKIQAWAPTRPRGFVNSSLHSPELNLCLSAFSRAAASPTPAWTPSPAGHRRSSRAPPSSCTGLRPRGLLAPPLSSPGSCSPVPKGPVLVSSGLRLDPPLSAPGGLVPNSRRPLPLGLGSCPTLQLFLTAVTREALLPSPWSPGPQGSVGIGLNHEGLLALPPLLLLKEPSLRSGKRGCGGQEPNGKTGRRRAWGKGRHAWRGVLESRLSVPHLLFPWIQESWHPSGPPGPRSPALQNPCSLETLHSHHQDLFL